MLFDCSIEKCIQKYFIFIGDIIGQCNFKIKCAHSLLILTNSWNDTIGHCNFTQPRGVVILAISWNDAIGQCDIKIKYAHPC